VEKNAFDVKVQLSLLNSLFGEDNIEEKFLSLIREYPKVRKVLPILIAVRKDLGFVMNIDTKAVFQVDHLFKVKTEISKEDEILLLEFFRDSGLKNIFQDKKVSNLMDYVFWVEAGLDTNGRKNRSGKTMEKIVEEYIKNFCEKKWFQYKTQATVKWIQENWNITINSYKSERKFDIAIYDWEKVFLLETNFYGWGGSKLKAVAGEFSWLYQYLKEQWVKFFWITDGSIGWNTALRPLEDAYEKMEWNIFNISMLEDGVLDEIIL
jgi:type II restriction enzyme